MYENVSQGVLAYKIMVVTHLGLMLRLSQKYEKGFDEKHWSAEDCQERDKSLARLIGMELALGISEEEKVRFEKEIKKQLMMRARA